MPKILLTCFLLLLTPKYDDDDDIIIMTLNNVEEQEGSKCLGMAFVCVFKMGVRVSFNLL